jgi:thiol-disulfide isomerase/thioredoxin
MKIKNMKQLSSIVNSQKFFPFLIIVVFAAFLMQRQQGGDLPAPRLDILPEVSRSAEGTAFTLPDLSGKMVRLEDFRGSVVLLNFFATWCGPCREEMPGLEQLYRAYARKGLVVVGISSDVQGQEVVAPFVKQYGLSFPVLLDPKDTLSQPYRIRGIPTIYLLDRHGRVAGMHVGGADWNGPAAHALIEQLLQES